MWSVWKGGSLFEWASVGSGCSPARKPGSRPAGWEQQGYLVRGWQLPLGHAGRGGVLLQVQARLGPCRGALEDGACSHLALGEGQPSSRGREGAVSGLEDDEVSGFPHGSRRGLRLKGQTREGLGW